eukprot:scaffold7834_cov672-Prasinococcus_capsulatus_cf.AAC.2
MRPGKRGQAARFLGELGPGRSTIPAPIGRTRSAAGANLERGGPIPVLEASPSMGAHARRASCWLSGLLARAVSQGSRVSSKALGR